ncbi:MAG: type III-A CRISPR-associated RAMP protein Csm4, partial [Cyanobacteriota bacterium]
IKSLSGLYFLIHFPKADAQLADKLQAALHLLGEEGLGGERSSGAGRFEVQWLDLPEIWQSILNLPEQSVHHCLISLFWDNEPATLAQLITDTNDASYEIIERGGWIASPFSGRQLRRKMVRMFSEGSVFPARPVGKLADVKPAQFDTHQIYRNGIALSLPIKVSDQLKPHS